MLISRVTINRCLSLVRRKYRFFKSFLKDAIIARDSKPSYVFRYLTCVRAASCMSRRKSSLPAATTTWEVLQLPREMFRPLG